MARKIPCSNTKNNGYGKECPACLCLTQQFARHFSVRHSRVVHSCIFNMIYPTPLILLLFNKMFLLFYFYYYFIDCLLLPLPQTNELCQKISRISIIIININNLRAVFNGGYKKISIKRLESLRNNKSVLRQISRFKFTLRG